jgi:hypothetical protein
MPTTRRFTAERPLEDLVARLLVEHFPLRAAFGRRARVAGERLAHLLIHRLLEATLVFEHPEDLGPEVGAHLVVGELLDDHALGRRKVADDALRQGEEALAAHAHQSVNPRSRASFVLAKVKRRL